MSPSHPKQRDQELSEPLEGSPLEFLTLRFTSLQPFDERRLTSVGDQVDCLHDQEVLGGRTKQRLLQELFQLREGSTVPDDFIH
jgi:hypothetical protein